MKLFELKDIEPQLTNKQIEDFKHIQFMAKELNDPQGCRLGEYSRRIIVFPSGLFTMLKLGEKFLSETKSKFW